MSERGSFVTEYIYCDRCVDAATKVFSGKEKYLCCCQIPSWTSGGGYLPIFAGKVGGLRQGAEFELFESEVIPQLSLEICHEMRVAVLAEEGERIFHVVPSGKEKGERP